MGGGGLCTRRDVGLESKVQKRKNVLVYNLIISINPKFHNKFLGLSEQYNGSIYIYSACLFICLYLINVKTAEPTGLIEIEILP